MDLPESVRLERTGFGHEIDDLYSLPTFPATW